MTHITVRIPSKNITSFATLSTQNSIMIRWKGISPGWRKRRSGWHASRWSRFSRQLRLCRRCRRWRRSRQGRQWVRRLRLADWRLRLCRHCLHYLYSKQWEYFHGNCSAPNLKLLGIFPCTKKSKWNIPMYQMGKTKWKNNPTSTKLTLFCATSSYSMVNCLGSINSV